MPKSDVIKRNLWRDYLRGKGWKVRWKGGERWYRPGIRDTPLSLAEAYHKQHEQDERERASGRDQD